MLVNWHTVTATTLYNKHRFNYTHQTVTAQRVKFLIKWCCIAFPGGF